VDLPANPPAPQISALEVLEGKTGNTLARGRCEFLSQLMFYSASISASKRVSSTGAILLSARQSFLGNLHPTGIHSAREVWSIGPMAFIIPSLIPHWQNNVPSEILARNLSTTLPHSFSF